MLPRRVLQDSYAAAAASAMKTTPVNALLHRNLLLFVIPCQRGLHFVLAMRVDIVQ
jgi:hypothetical protein